LGRGRQVLADIGWAGGKHWPVTAGVFDTTTGALKFSRAQTLWHINMARLTRHMPAVAGYRERLATLQGAWDSLALLSHLGEDGTNLSGTRQAFESLAGDLVTQLEAETHKKALLAVRARAQVTIDILVRNLFERTADIGFLAGDESLRRLAREIPELREAAAQPEATMDDTRAVGSATRALQRRLGEFVAKYSVYHNVVVVSPQGEVLAQLENGTAPAITRDPLIAATLTGERGYVETSRHSDLVPEARRALIYSHRIVGESGTLGVLCLCFRLEDECEAIFARLRSPGDWMVLALLDPQNEVIATSDPYQLPLGARVPPGNADGGDIVRFAGREFLAVTREAHPYQGYAGPKWRGHVMVPVERAFESEGQAADVGCTSAVLTDLRSSAATFSTALREIPRKADSVQRDLNRSVWNGSVRLSLTDAGDSRFAKALLREISNMGRKTQDVFEHSIEELHETIVSSVLHDSRFMASLASELLGRSLYERANDCRWWALDSTLVGHLTQVEGCDVAAVGQVLSQINSLYTVYRRIVLLDSERRVVATSRPDDGHLSGMTMDADWAGVAGAQGYSVSGFEASVLYDNRPTWIFAAPVKSEQGQVVGAVAVVFDSGPQLAAMLQDALPRDERGHALPGCDAMFLDRQGRVVASSSGSTEAYTAAAESGMSGARVVKVGEIYQAVGVQPDAGYREYPGLGGCAVVSIPIGKVAEHQGAVRGGLPQWASTARSSKQDILEFATFAAGDSWYGLPTANVVEAADARALQTLPTAEYWCAGYLMFGGEPIAVADLAKVLGNPRTEQERMVVIVRVPGRAKPFGLLVEVLGDVAEVPTDHLLSIDGSSEQLATLAIEPAHANSPMVVILSPERLANLFFGFQQAATQVA
jgi:chemotaxis signal transduction protein